MSSFKYEVRYAPSFCSDMEKLDRVTEKRIANWIDQYLINVDIPTSHEKYLSGMLAGFVRFWVGSYRIVALVNNGTLYYHKCKCQTPFRCLQAIKKGVT